MKSKYKNSDLENEDIKDDFEDIDSMMSAMMFLNGSGYPHGDLDRLIGVTRTLMSSLEKKITPLLAD
ncbi:TPA: hypothetical protein PXM19_001790 [Yersinia enterocolitica]|uniref:hypothetical protein n=1 Tax=Yersinia enterocolitica TaxID=630 RepID=UPI0005DD6919|nr:hypothetical protein [Yersinia enterocolitica]AOF14387.1 hypothetical protein BB936_07775 [Yersinia enterocolitica]CFV19597.1 Uncharacterised protein [Yersinia enterocolitica]CNE04701.1 Uncharacterised protein [Yersinia enterocolitica]HDL6966414.1 hypothetical protein [Yersinia enterocolitica]HDL6974622.1 hypothetical protein [Yersinia enterocolitica]